MKFKKIKFAPGSPEWQEELVRRAFHAPDLAIREIFRNAALAFASDLANVTEHGDGSSLIGRDYARMLSCICAQEDPTDPDRVGQWKRGAVDADAVRAYWCLETAPRNSLAEMLERAGYAG